MAVLEMMKNINFLLIEMLMLFRPGNFYFHSYAFCTKLKNSKFTQVFAPWKKYLRTLKCKQQNFTETSQCPTDILHELLMYAKRIVALSVTLSIKSSPNCFCYLFFKTKSQ
jgi:hypothetical protein